MSEIDNKKTIWVFGDSFSEDVTSFPAFVENERVRYIKERLNGIPYKIWARIVAENLGFNYINKAASCGKFFKHLCGGNSNDQMFYNVTEYSNQFKKGDVVFIGFTSTNRFQVVKPCGGIESCLPNHDFGEDTPRHMKTLVDREHPYYVHEILQKFKLLETLSNIVGFKIYYWDWTDTFYQKVPTLNTENWILHQIYGKWPRTHDVIRDSGGKYSSIIDETDGKYHDGHWGIDYNNVFGQIITDYLHKVL